MLPTRPSRHRLISASAVVALVAAGLATATSPVTAAPGPDAAPAKAVTAGRYLVTFEDEPAATYQGGIPGYPKTAPGRGSKLEPSRPEVVRYRDRLAAQHDNALKSVGATKLYDYSVATNGVAAELTAAQVRALAKVPGVTGMEKDALREPTTSESPRFLGLSAPGGLWNEAPASAGKGVIVGVIDSGIWPESASFAGSALRRNKAGQPVEADGRRIAWSGACVQGAEFSSQSCNDKLIGARYYVKSFGTKNIAQGEFLSPRDGDGHGTHTASTAAGNVVESVTVDGSTFGPVAGMAPGARVAAYKVCWEAKPGASGGCFNGDSVAAIDDAVADGVDVLNYSVGGSSESGPLDVVEQAFRRAAQVGVFVANSAGNSGPGASTLDHPSPWLTTVAASTFRGEQKSITLGGDTLTGAGTGPNMTAAAPLVTSVAAKAAGATTTSAAICAPGTLDPAKAKGKVVQCDRGVVDRTAKSHEVRRAGGVGMVMTNVSANSLNGDLHFVPTVHLPHTVRETVQKAAQDGVSVQIVTSSLEAATPEVAAFSSRGPSTTTGGDILKPDIAAPGVDVLAAVAPPTHYGRAYDMLSGTSMSSPHIAGLGALVMAAHRDWTPAAIKSALMTTARDHATSSDPFAQGAGFVDPNKAVDPGLVFAQPVPAGGEDPMARQWREYMVGLGRTFLPPNDKLAPRDGSDVNQASVAIGSLAGQQTVTRTVTNVGAAEATYVLREQVPGVSIQMAPSSFSLAPGASQTFALTVTFDEQDGGVLGQWSKGSAFLEGGPRPVRFPVAVRPVAVAAPAEVSGSGSIGTATVTLRSGFTGLLEPTVTGLAAADAQPGVVTTGAFTPAPGAATKAYPLVVPTGAALVRVDLDAASAADDLDLYLYDDKGNEVAYSASAAADEQVTLSSLEAGTYTAYVNGYDTGGGGAYAYTAWVVMPGSAGNAKVTPASQPVELAREASVDLTWSGLQPGRRYLGFVTWLAGSQERTIVSIG